METIQLGYEVEKDKQVSAKHYCFDGDKVPYEWFPNSPNVESTKEMLKSLVWNGHEVELVIARPWDNHIRGTRTKGYENYEDQIKHTQDAEFAILKAHLDLLGIEYAKHYTIRRLIVGPTMVDAEQMKQRYISGHHDTEFGA